MGGSAGTGDHTARGSSGNSSRRANGKGFKRRRLTLALAVVLVVAGCNKAGGADGGTLTVGGVGPLSQPGAVQAGQDMRWAMQAAVDDVNAAGGVLGRKVALSFEDTQNQPAVAAAAARKLVEDKRVVGVVGEYHSGAALAQIPVYSEHGTPAVIVEAYNDKITAGDPADPKLPPRPPSVFRIAPTSSYANALNVDRLTQGVHATDVVQLYEATDYGTGQASTLKKGLEGRGVTLTQIKVDLNQPDYSAILQRVRQEHPAATVFVFDVTGESSYVIEQNAFGAGLLGPGKICVANQAAQDAKAFWRAVPDGAGCLFRLAGPPPARRRTC